MVYDRWRWLRSRLPARGDGRALLDAGCGNGWLTINLASDGFECLGLGWNDDDLARARRRSQRFATSAAFDVQDLRRLDERTDLAEAFDVVTCTETIEHIIDDASVVRGLARALKPGGILLLTAPNVEFRPIGGDDVVEVEENGGHVRKGYGPDDLRALCAQACLEVEEIGGCSGVASQNVTRIQRVLTRRVGYPAAWVISAPLRIIPIATRKPSQRRPYYSICMAARKPLTAG
jgi:2-polyprenyl-3-methyl-5-hydroxy-6-metoxy-1,4-benzoquinol methylase